MDPLIKSQLLYQLSYAPGSPAHVGGPGPLAKARRAGKLRRASKSQGYHAKKPPGRPGGFSAAARSVREKAPARCLLLIAVGGGQRAS